MDSRDHLAYRAGMPAAGKDSPYQVQVLDRAVSILDALAAHGDLSLFELAERLSLHKSTIHRLLMVLERHRLIERIGASGKYGLGLRLFEYGNKAFTRLGIGERALPYLERLAREVGETAHLCILEDGDVLYLEKVEPSRTVRVPSSVGQRNPAHCTAVGKALLAHLADAELDALIERRGLKAHTRNTITTVADLKRELRMIRERGYSIDDEEIEEGLRCIGAPVRDHGGRVVASMSIAGPAFRVTRAKVPMLARRVMKVADELSAELGHRALRRASKTG
jgi:IclR family transcriptional regulator, KDG regulon repressor